MNSGLVQTTILLLGTLMLTAVSSYGGDDSSAKKKHARNPHGANGDCSVCHVASIEMLRGLFVLPSTKRQLVADPTTLCQNCHGVGFGHGIGNKPSLNLSGLPVGADGMINCALTCHDMHVSGVDDYSQEHFHLRLPQRKLCVSCHDK